MLVAGAVEIKWRQAAVRPAQGDRGLDPPAVFNLKRWGLGVYHGLRRTNLQHYLDEFVFRFNRRRTRDAAFDTCSASAPAPPRPYHVLIRKAA